MISRSGSASFSRINPFSTCGKTPSAHNQRRTGVNVLSVVPADLHGQQGRGGRGLSRLGQLIADVGGWRWFVVRW